MSSFPTGRRPASRVPVPFRLSDAPIAQGMVVPFVTLAHRDRSRPVWGKLDPKRRVQVLREQRCQVCGDALTDPVVLFLRPADYARGIAAEPGLHPECGMYSRRACPMLAGTVDRYNPHPALHRCPDPECQCARWREPEPAPGQAIRDGQPAEAWYEAWIGLDDYSVTIDPDEPDPLAAPGVLLWAPVRIRKLRRIRDAAPAAEPHGPDLLGALMAARLLFGMGEQH